MKNQNPKSPKLAKWLFDRIAKSEEKRTIYGDMDEYYYELAAEEGLYKATLWFWMQIMGSIGHLIKSLVYWRFVMFHNYIRTALRKMKKQKGYSFINITGLAIGVACCILIMLFVADEVSYDRYHAKAHRIYRIGFDGVLNDNVDHHVRSCAPLAQIMVNEFPEVEAVTRFRNYGAPVFRYKEMVFSEERVFAADPTFFDVFTVPFIQGDPKTALNLPNGLVLTRSMANKYFGHADPMGKIIIADNRTDYVVTGVVEDVPRNSHFHFDFLQSLAGRDGAENPIWFFNDFYTYIVVQENTSPQVLEEKLLATTKKHVGPQIQRLLGINLDQLIAGGGKFQYFLQPLTDIHLHSHHLHEVEPNGNIAYVYIFSTIAFGILLIACLNFVNLSTARSALCAKEVGIRKTVGSQRNQLIRQFLVETVFMSFLAVMVAVGIAQLLLPVFNNFSQKELSLPFLTNGAFIPLLLGLSGIIGILAGLYPALCLSSFHPVKVLKGDTSQSGRKSVMRNVLVVVQFSISIILIAGTLVVRRQLSFIQTRNLGFKMDRVVIINKVDDLGGQIDAFKQELLKLPGVFSASSSSNLMGKPFETGAFRTPTMSHQETRLIWYFSADPDFVQTYDVEITKGRFFSEERSADVNNVVINEAAVHNLGLTEPVGKELIGGVGRNMMRYRIIGVAKDFHYESLHQQIRPMIIAPRGVFGGTRYVSVRVRSENIREALDSIKTIWHQFASNQAFDYLFFDDHFAKVYLTEEKTSQIFFVFSILAMIIANLGLFGLSAFIAEQRTKEIGIRKVLGSSVGGVIVLLVKQFTKWVVVANLIAWPVAYFAMHRWLENFAYRTNIELWILLLSGLIAFGIAIVTVSFQSVKAAMANPVEALKYE